MSSESDIELLELNRQRTINNNNLQCLQRTVAVTLIVTSLIFIIQIFIFSSAVYLYIKEYNLVTAKIHDVEQLINQTMTVLHDWEMAYHQIQPYLGQVCTLFNSC